MNAQLANKELSYGSVIAQKVTKSGRWLVILSGSASTGQTLGDVPSASLTTQPDEAGQSQTVLPLSAGTITFVDRLYAVVEQEIANPDFTVDQLATALAVSTRTLNRRLKTLLGTHATALIRNCRLQKAADWLREGQGIAETAYLTGFDSPSYFGKCFKELFGVSPSEYTKIKISKIQVV